MDLSLLSHLYVVVFSVKFQCVCSKLLSGHQHVERFLSNGGGQSAKWPLLASAMSPYSSYIYTSMYHFADRSLYTEYAAESAAVLLVSHFVSSHQVSTRAGLSLSELESDLLWPSHMLSSPADHVTSCCHPLSPPGRRRHSVNVGDTVCPRHAKTPDRVGS
jgi:hypothetical protein